MQLVKTVEYFVSGSMKKFDIYQCIVDEVSETTDSKDRKQITIDIDGQEYKGLYNKKVFEHLVENEGQGSFIVLWRSPKGNSLIAYAWEIWRDYIEGVTPSATAEPKAPDVQDSGEAFVYLWVNKTNDQKYIGTHKGSDKDGYICSGGLMLEEFNKNPQNFVRTVLAYGSQQAMKELETMLILQLGASRSGMYYNRSNNLRT
jgi:hypothetical protein